INQALGYSQSLVRRPIDTIMLLISDLYEGGDQSELIKRAAAVVASGVRLIVLLALSDDGAPAYDHDNAAAFAALGCAVFAPPHPAPADDGRRHRGPRRPAMGRRARNPHRPPRRNASVSDAATWPGVPTISPHVRPWTTAALRWLPHRQDLPRPEPRPGVTRP